MELQEYLDIELKKLAPIYTVRFPDLTDKANWSIDFIPIATAEERAAAEGFLDSFDLTTFNSNLANQELAISDIKEKWHLTASIKGKTPAEIYTLVQGQIDSWSSLADAKADLREWMPLMIAAIAWQVMRDEHTT